MTNGTETEGFEPESTEQGPAETVQANEPTPTAEDAQTTDATSEDSASGQLLSQTDESPEDSEDDSTSDAKSSGASGAESVPDAATADATQQDTPQDHLFRVTHQQHNQGDPNPHSIVTTAATDAATAVKWLASHVHDIRPLIAALEELL
jgi:hypothetical protein